jgi:fumarylacetoacetase
MRKSWVEYPENHPFPLENLPYGVFSREGEAPRVGVAIGDFILDLNALQEEGLLSHVPKGVFAQPCLNDFVAQGRKTWLQTREQLQDLLSDTNPRLRDKKEWRERALIPAPTCRLHLPMRIGQFVDFYSSIYHATNVGRMFRPENPLFPNYRHIPVAYNGRASTVVPSDTPIRRPRGPYKSEAEKPPVYAPTRALDFELEMGFFTGKENPLGTSVSPDEAEEYIFGFVLVNDWSARDIQRWEYQPLGPFLSKSFATTISPWVVTLEALKPFLVEGEKQEPTPPPHLLSTRPWHLNIRLRVHLKTQKMREPLLLTEVNFRQMYWSPAQQLAHQTSNGTNVQVGDLYASGTVSTRYADGETPPHLPDQFGCLLEHTWGGKFPLVVPETGEERVFLADGDTVAFTGWAEGEGYRVGFGECSGTIIPAEGTSG